jgi:aspartate/methionine/tyrosine aminotransferase
MITRAKRLDTVEEYYFSKKLREVALLKAHGKPIINLGIGSPDLSPPYKAIEALKESLSDENAHKYQSYQGLPEFREAIADFYKQHFGVSLSPKSEVLPLMGSKEGIMHISMTFLDEGDEVLIPNPGYPTYSSVTKLLGAKPMYYNLKEDNNWQPNLLELERSDLSKVKLMWINYPHMPTGATATNKMFDDIIAFAKRHNILIINDNPYSFILNNKPKSLLSINGAKDVAIELNSLSKSFNLAGWRIGMVVGSSKYLNNILKVKSNMDSGMYYGIQQGAIAALRLSDVWFDEINAIYTKRRAVIWEICDQINCAYDKLSTGMFVWAKIPKDKTSNEITDELLYKYNVFITPGTVFGSNGEGYIRFSLCVPEKKIKEVLTRIKKTN